jgi:homoserine dehydrogenase
VSDEIRVGLIGFGTIGTGVIKLLQQNRAQIRARLGVPVRLVRIADIDLKRDRGVRVPKDMLTREAGDILDDPQIGIVVELMGGYEPAKSFVLRAVRNGKSVVTANKALLALHGREIFAAAERAGVDLGYEAAVGGGIPIIRTLREALGGDHNTAVYGIVNGTANYILSKMSAEGEDFAAVLAKAQQHGLAEANPTFDIDGIDSAHKLTLLVQLAFGTAARFEDIAVEGIRNISRVDISFAREFGYVIKLLAIAKRDDGRIEARVHPTMVPRNHVLADVNGAFNAIAVQGKALGSSVYFGLGAGMMPTATAVVADVIEAAGHLRRNCRGRVPPLGYPIAQQVKARFKPMADVVTEYYLRFMVVDRPNVLAKIAGILGRHRISIASVIQQGREEGATVPIVIRTHHARERELRAALRAIDRLPITRSRSTAIRIEDSLGS